MTNTPLSLLTATLLLTSTLYAEETLSPIMITSANRTTQSLESTTSDVSVISAEEIESNGYQSVAQAISHVPGITFTNNGGLGKVTSIFMRGMKTEKILLLLDGMPLNNPSSTDGQAFFEHIPMENIAQIEIIKGGTSAVWGSDASAGVVNIITKSAKEGLHGGISFGYGSYDTRKVAADISYKEKRFDALLNVSKVQTEGFSAKLPKDDEADGYDNEAITLKLGYHFSNAQSIRFKYSTIDANTEYDGAFSDLGSNDPLANIDTKQKDFALTYLYHVDYFSSTLNLAQNSTDRLDTSDSSYGEALVQYNATQQMLSWINTYTYENTRILLGLEARKIKGEYQFNDFAPTTNTFNDKALFIGLNHTLTTLPLGKTVLEGNLRQDFFEKFDNKLSYKLGAKQFYHALKGLTTTLNYYRSTDAPNSYQVANALNGQTLLPDTTKGFDLSAQYKNIGITYFSNMITHKLAYDFVNYGYVNNQGEERVNGIELSAMHSFSSPNLLLSANLTHLLNYEDESGANLDKRAKDTVNLSLDHYLSEHTHYGLEALYIGKREEFGESTGDYTLLHAHFGTKVMKEITVAIHLKNIFDLTYENTYGYATEGRALYGTLRYRF